MSANRSVYSNRNLWSGILFGIGIMGFIDEAVFHQILQWHHFYDRATTHIGMVSDGFFHAFSWFAAVGGLFMFADLLRRQALWKARWWGGILLGAGGFQLYDGLIQHKVMNIHQVRYNVDLLPYDLAWNIGAAVLIILGIILIMRTRRGSGTML